jgi:phospholipid/cholesterol/gamma-HCH transport system substrate-binding protein
MNGVLVGKVSSVERDVSGGVLIDIEMSKEDIEHVPANVVARILPATVFGTTFVDLIVHGTPAKDDLEAGDQIEADVTQGTLEFQQALDDIDRLVTALGPAELASAIGSAAQAVDGRGERLATTVDTLNSYLARLNPRMPAVRDDLRALATAVDVVDEVAPDLLDATEDGLVFTNSLIHQEAALTALLTGGIQLADDSYDFLSRNEQRLLRFIRGTGSFVDVLYDNRRAGITDAMTINMAIGRALPSVIRQGFIESDAVFRGDLPEGYYGEDDRPSFASMVGQGG